MIMIVIKIYKNHFLEDSTNIANLGCSEGENAYKLLISLQKTLGGNHDPPRFHGISESCK